jgi:hypothetical protein
LAFVFLVAARPIYNVHDREFSSTAATLTLNQIADVIATAGLKRGWDIKKERPGLLLGKLYIRIHYAAVTIAMTVRRTRSSMPTARI